MAVVVVASICVTACGSSSTSRTSAKTPAGASTPGTPSTPSTPTTSATASGSRFIAALNSACKNENAASGAAPNTVAAQSAIQQKNIETQSKLSPPANLKAMYAKYLSLLKENLAQYERGDAAGTTKTVAELKPLKQQLAAAGARDCGP